MNEVDIGFVKDKARDLMDKMEIIRKQCKEFNKLVKSGINAKDNDRKYLESHFQWIRSAGEYLAYSSILQKHYKGNDEMSDLIRGEMRSTERQLIIYEKGLSELISEELSEEP